MNPSAENDDRLETLLQASTPPELPGHDFTVAVMAALPSSEKPERSWPRLAACAVGAAVGTTYALWQSRSSGEIFQSFDHSASLLISALAPLAQPVFAAALAITALSLLFAFAADLRDKLLS